MGMAVNLVAYQCAWFACVLGAAHQRPALGIAVALAALLLHLAAAREPRRELGLLACAIVAGLLFESGLAASGWVRANDALLLAERTPLLMVLLWGVFATTLNVSLRPLRQRYLVVALLAAAGAPLAYAAGERLGALHWISATPALLLISAGWALLLPALMRAAQRFDGYAQP